MQPIEKEAGKEQTLPDLIADLMRRVSELEAETTELRSRLYRATQGLDIETIVKRVEEKFTQSITSRLRNR